jgi:aldehyde oxidoreductase
MPSHLFSRYTANPSRTFLSVGFGSAPSKMVAFRPASLIIFLIWSATPSFISPASVDRPILCKEKVFQFGDAIAIVAADTEEHARAAAAKVKVDLEVLPAYMSGWAAMAPDAIEIHPGVPNIYYEQGVVKGEETAPLMEQAAFTEEIETYCSRQPHLHLEPDCGCAYLEDNGRLTIQSKSIGLQLHAAMIGPGLGVEPDKLRLIQNGAGGTFGYKFSPTMEALLGVACLATERPVSLVYSQYQNIT